MLFRVFPRLAVAIGFAVFSSLAAHAYDSIVVFGDSYNDVGNLSAVAAHAGIVYPPPPYYPGHFSNGPIWVEDLASDWGLPMLPAAIGGTNYAFGGAELLASKTIDQLPVPSVLEQVAAYLAVHGGKADPNALYVLEGGGNDILDSTTFDPKKLGCEIAAGLYGLEVALRNAGAKSFLIPELIDVGQLPAAIAGWPLFAKFARSASVRANMEMEQLFKVDKHLPGIEIYQLHVFRTFNAVANSATHFGFADVTTPCVILDGLTVVSECSDPVRTLWWDGEHPTQFGHAFFAVLVEGRLSNH